MPTWCFLMIIMMIHFYLVEAFIQSNLQLIRLSRGIILWKIYQRCGRWSLQFCSNVVYMLLTYSMKKIQNISIIGLVILQILALTKGGMVPKKTPASGICGLCQFWSIIALALNQGKIWKHFLSTLRLWTHFHYTEGKLWSFKNCASWKVVLSKL